MDRLPLCLEKLSSVRILVSTIIVLLSAGVAAAGPLEESNAAYNKGDHLAAIQLLKGLATEGERSAQLKLGTLYEEGRAVPKNSDEAIRWYCVASAQGDADAPFHIGRIYDDGRGVPQDYARALKWYRVGANRGEPKAQVNLGEIYASGRGVPKNYAEAAKWFRIAAEYGNELAQNNLGVLYLKGTGVRRDYVRAHVWFNLAARQGNLDAIANRDYVSRIMSPLDIARAQKLASEWTKIEQ